MIIIQIFDDVNDNNSFDDDDVIEFDNSGVEKHV